ncbi:translation elongation factor ef-1 [Grosmannia clavigera kw1407]|uniref:Elongation factor 1 alpha-like protein n=1 Tax=Grosmannia clavigera (strain kw1407 / UAMH 11150) TaxID=655863 RepID=F0XLW7_GROCL|nr:translation elongation factor ef-1 [Grosmannia clavigera kw1407]EFX01223.1 translation elongation factor ef-1 [Grosmannia clavigera kw1407]
MSRHQDYRNYDYEQDLGEYDGEDEGDEMSPEDRALLALSVEEATERLGENVKKVPQDSIAEAVYHYYYDVDKAVAYLVKTFINPSPAPAPAAKQAKQAKAKAKQDSPDAKSSYASFFEDMPWLGVPQSRQTIFVAPLLPRGGLLGGASVAPKMSKLQALAAQRKRKAEEAKKTKEVGFAAEKTQPQAKVDEHTSKSLKLALRAVRQPPMPTEKAVTEAPKPAEAEAPKVPAAEAVPMEGVCGPSGAAVHEQREAAQVAKPSAFAQALFGPKKRKRRISDVAEGGFLAVPSLARAPAAAFEAFLSPSPDDVVLQAQAKAFGKATPTGTPAKKRTGAAGAAGQTESTEATLANGVKGLKVDDTPLPRSKNLDVLAEYEKSAKKKNASFVVVGHVDAGKSTMMGRLLLEMKRVDSRTIDKYRKAAKDMGKASFVLAWVLDQGSDERAHGVTIDIATRRFETATTAFTMLDAPGHRDFIPNMIAGASQADFAVLVIDASRGSFESGLKGQTREHALLMRSMGVTRIIVAVNKLDTVGWDRERFEAICQQMGGFLSATGFQAKNISFVPVSGLHGDNLVTRSTAPEAQWYEGATLVEELDRSEPLARALDKPLRLPVAEAFRSTAGAVTVSGRIEAGSLQVGDALLVQPAGEKAHVKQVELQDGSSSDTQTLDWAVAGQSVIVHLAGIEAEHVRPGDVLCDLTKPVTCVDVFSIKVLAFDMLFPMPVEVHRGRINESAKIEELTALLNKTSGTVEKRRPKVVKPGAVARLRVRLHTKLPLERGQRIVLRSEGHTIAAGLLE